MSLLLGVDLEGRDVLLVGGGAVAARRARMLREQGARVRVVAPALDPVLEDLAAIGRIRWIPRTVRRRDLRGAWLVHAATGAPAVDQQVAQWCSRRRILCVTAARAGHGSARIAAQATSGEVRVGVVSQAGADPLRSCAVRDAITALLDQGALPVQSRRGAVGEGPRRLGSVALVGGGPGPLDLLTVRARRLIAEADVLVVDRLGPGEELARSVREDVEVIRVGKAPGHHPVPQERISALLVEHARAGRSVVRVKGGDPFVLGRGGEEYTACLAAGVGVEVVPGITSAIAVPQAAGVPVTHRGTAGSLHVVSGHDAAGTAGISPATLAALADATVTTVVLMGVAALPEIVGRALDHGVPASRPVAIIENGHTPRQRTTRTALGTAVRDAHAAGVASPAVIVIGEVAREGLLLPGPTSEPVAESARGSTVQPTLEPTAGPPCAPAKGRA
ncbi:uroporphyrinogen-III C-methyltransferase [Brachybacterium halotolerans subsp. kimchii]|uniref:uroporphyrinogen-III C-methyltransferase n=1 Tax=Brachybacterium halotolerans TaxID=2795215 RepID=UPI001E3E1158|nr:uroporphyrinogen-III C-methyltransferase [Brachybacterium halotolerans]UEJ81535.1 uroporphyrinogen-III C-methyltransferase [Brachybacterium halotolerans subsp. kimchii]